MKIVTIKQLVSRGIWDLVIVLAGYGSNNNKSRVYENVDRLPFWSQISSSESTICNETIF